jgi:hypothetical protein
MDPSCKWVAGAGGEPVQIEWARDGEEEEEEEHHYQNYHQITAHHHR